MDGSPLFILLFCLSHIVQFNFILIIIHEPEMIQKKVIDPDVPLIVWDSTMTFVLMGNA